MDYLTAIDNNGKMSYPNNNEFIANDTETTWWWTNNIVPVEEQDPWISTYLFPNGCSTFNPWHRQTLQIRQGEKSLLENFLLFPYLYQSVAKANRLYYPATVWYPSPWFSNGQHKLALWNLLGGTFDFPILWQTPNGTAVKNAVHLTSTRQLVDLIAPRLGNVTADTRIFFHIRNGKMLNLTTSVQWKNPWCDVKDKSRDWLSNAIYHIILDNPTDPIDILLRKICTIPVDIESL